MTSAYDSAYGMLSTKSLKLLSMASAYGWLTYGKPQRKPGRVWPPRMTLLMTPPMACLSKKKLKLLSMTCAYGWLMYAEPQRKAGRVWPSACDSAYGILSKKILKFYVWPLRMAGLRMASLKENQVAYDLRVWLSAYDFAYTKQKVSFLCKMLYKYLLLLLLNYYQEYLNISKNITIFYTNKILFAWYTRSHTRVIRGVIRRESYAKVIRDLVFFEACHTQASHTQRSYVKISVFFLINMPYAESYAEVIHDLVFFEACHA